MKKASKADQRTNWSTVEVFQIKSANETQDKAAFCLKVMLKLATVQTSFEFLSSIHAYHFHHILAVLVLWFD